MPIQLPERSPSGEAATPPNPIIWLTLLVVFLAVGAAWTLLSWPKGQLTGTPWFWMQLLGYPSLAWGALFGLRLHFHDEVRNYLAAREAVRQSDRDEAIAFGAEPLAVLGVAYQCAMAPSGASKRIANRESAVQARAPKPNLTVNRHTRLAFTEGGDSIDRYRRAFQALLAAIEALDSATYQLTWQGVPDTREDAKGSKAGSSESPAEGHGPDRLDPDSLTARAAKLPPPAEVVYPVSYQMRTEVGQGPLEMLALRGFVLPSRIFVGQEPQAVAIRARRK